MARSARGTSSSGEAIIRSKAAGATIFDMWGRSTPGIAHFKAGFGGQVVEYGGTWDLVVNPMVRSLYLHGRRAFVRLARRRRGLTTRAGAASSSGGSNPASGSD